MKKSIFVGVVLNFALFAFAAPSRNSSAKIVMPLPEDVKILEVAATGEFKTIEEALDKVEEIRAKDTKTPLAIRIASGDYFQKWPVEINSRHSTTNMAPLFIYAADFAKKPRFHGGVAITGWKKTTLNGNKKVWCADAPDVDLPERPTILTLNGVRLQPARYPNLDPTSPYRSFAVSKKATAAEKNRHTDEIWIADEDVRSWAHPEDARVIFGSPVNYGDSVANILNVTNQIIHIKRAHDLQKNWRGVWDHWYVENMAEELDEPGEWYYNPREKKFYLLPPAGTDLTKAVIVCGKPIRIFNLTRVGNCTIAGLEFTGSLRDGIAMSANEKVNVHACYFHALGKSGVLVDGCNLKISDNDIDDVCNGIFILNHCGNCGRVDGRMNVDVENNYIHHCKGTGIWLWGQGVHIRNNLIHDMPRSAINGFGRFCEISYNRLRHLNTTTDDAGAIYDNRWSNGVGTHICYNWISDSIGFRSWGHGTYESTGAVGIYLDECSGGLTIYGNLVEHCHLAGIHMHNGRWTTVSNNVFISNGMQANIYTYQISVQTWNKAGFQGTRLADYGGEYRAIVKGDPRWRNFPSMSQDPNLPEGFSSNDTMIMGLRFVRNIFYYPDQSAGHMLMAPHMNSNTNFFNQNIYWPGKGGKERVSMFTGVRANKKGYSRWDVWQKQEGQDKDSVVIDPHFRDLKRRDYRLVQNSRAFKLGFEELPYDKMGLRKTLFRPVLPKEAEGLREHPEWLKPRAKNSAKGSSSAKNSKHNKRK